MSLKQYKKDQLELQSLKNQLQNLIKEEDYTTFLLKELQSISLQSMDQLEMETQFEQLNNVEFIKENLNKSLLLANEEQYGILHNLNELKIFLNKIITFSPNYRAIFDRVETVYIELKDSIDELSQKEEDLIHDPEKLHELNQQLQLLYSLQKKHQVTTISELQQIQTQLEAQVHAYAAIENSIEKIENQLNSTSIILDDLANLIHENRKNAIPILAEKWIEILSQLGMPNVRFQIELNQVSNYFLNGKDALQFLFSANKGSDFGLLKKVASGGELSRIMLATKAILATYSKLPTIIFDEIDTGVSGEIANKMSEIMKNMSHSMQVIAITHLPQIAAKGDAHFKVFKSILEEQTNTEMKILNNEERILEIAQMLSGIDVSESALNHAKALLN